jgi:hypothetical protein
MAVVVQECFNVRRLAPILQGGGFYLPTFCQCFGALVPPLGK